MNFLNFPLSYVPYGGDYSPEQWTEADWKADIDCLRKAHVNMASLGIFSWASIETSPGHFDFDWLDRAIDLFAKNEISICLSTGTAAHPAWLSQAHPECLITTVDGSRMRHGRRINFCSNSLTYRDAAKNYVTKIAERYAHHPAVLVWHIGNEYGHGARGSYCYCDECGRSFREWLKVKYGSLDALNHTWFTAFWGHKISDWEQIEPPSFLNDQNPAGPSMLGAKSVDYRRFQSASHLACFRAEREILRSANPEIPATTNLMGAYRDLNYFEWAPHLDFISWDCYTPGELDPAAPAFHHDLMRSLKPDQPFWLMEQSPIQESIHPGPRLRKPGGLRTQSLQAIARGADAILFFQLRQGRSGCEKFCSAFVEQGRRTDTYTFLECAALGKQLAESGTELRRGLPVTQTAILFDWETWWAYSHCALHAKSLDYLEESQRYHGALYDLNVVPDFVSYDSDFSQYSVLVLPLCYAFPVRLAQKLETFVAAGGKVIMGAFSGRADENDSLWPDSAPGPLRSLFGVRVEEFAQVVSTDQIMICGPDIKSDWSAQKIVELATSESAEVIASFSGGIVDGRPAITRRQDGNGSAYYIATSLERMALKELFIQILSLTNDSPARLERVVRSTEGGVVREFLLNHSDTAIPMANVPPPQPGVQVSSNSRSEVIPARDHLIVEWK